MKKLCGILCAVLMVSVIFGGQPVLASGTVLTRDNVTRLSGNNRYDTAYAIAKAAFPSGAKEAVLVSGRNFPDALTANAYAGAKHIPVLITDPQSLSAKTAELMNEWGITKVEVIGGSAAVSENVLAGLQSAGVPSAGISRIAGKTRYLTAEAVYEQGVRENVFTKSACIVTTGAKSADALSISPWSYAYGMPVFLANGKGTLTAKALGYVKSFSKVYILGSTSSVSKTVQTALGSKAKRIYGTNRYATSVAIAKAFSTGSYNNTAFASGSDSRYVDALVSGMFCGKMKAPIVLLNGTAGPGFEFVMKTVSADSSVNRLYVMGGPASVSRYAVDGILKYWRKAVTKMTFTDNGYSVAYTYDSRGNLKTGYGKYSGGSLTYTYDSGDRLLNSMAFDHQVNRFSYNSDGYVVQQNITAHEGYKTSIFYSYDKDHNVTGISQAYFWAPSSIELGRVAMTYDSEGRLTKEVTYKLGNKTVYETRNLTYDSAGRLTADRYYDASGTLIYRITNTAFNSFGEPTEKKIEGFVSKAGESDLIDEYGIYFGNGGKKSFSQTCRLGYDGNGNLTYEEYLSYSVYLEKCRYTLNDWRNVI